ncbi:uncharacterized protein LOC111829411 [Capsella rubella]|uniref:uncharacterized protein LOC111829411 n=1 Tax=Capsella rubella TaxID=81985 RepID=UPI000CD51406|nr:uncharacterized protein LOC111829411 [Capsella rubella]
MAKKPYSPSFGWRSIFFDKEFGRKGGSYIYKPDRLIWHYTKSGKYTVKSGVCMAYSCSPKIKHFIWQVATGTLPVMDCLASRKIQCDTVCKKCGSEIKTINHALFECTHSRRIWDLSTIPMLRGGFPYNSRFANLDFIFWSVIPCLREKEKKHLFPWILWFIWKDRNKKVFQRIQSEPVDIINQALSEQLLCEKAQAIPTESVTPLEPIPTPSLILRCRIDSWKSGNTFTGLGWWCFRGEEQTYLLGAKCFSGCPSPLHSELEALIWAMESILIRRIDCHRFESDCAELITMVQDPQEWPAFSNLLNDFLLLRVSFPSFLLTKTR